MGDSAPLFSSEERDPFEIIEDHTAKTHPFYGIGVQQHRNDTIRNVMQTTRVLAVDMTRKPSREHQITIGHLGYSKANLWNVANHTVKKASGSGVYGWNC